MTKWGAVERIIVWIVFAGVLLALRVMAGMTLEFLLMLVFFTVSCAQNEATALDLYGIRKSLLEERTDKRFDFRTIQSDCEADSPPNNGDDSRK